MVPVSRCLTRNRREGSGYVRDPLQRSNHIYEIGVGGFGVSQPSATVRFCTSSMKIVLSGGEGFRTIGPLPSSRRLRVGFLTFSGSPDVSLLAQPRTDHSASSKISGE